MSVAVVYHSSNLKRFDSLFFLFVFFILFLLLL